MQTWTIEVTLAGRDLDQSLLRICTVLRHRCSGFESLNFSRHGSTGKLRVEVVPGAVTAETTSAALRRVIGVVGVTTANACADDRA